VRIVSSNMEMLSIEYAFLREKLSFTQNLG
jgi:hypothetical protein